TRSAPRSSGSAASARTSTASLSDPSPPRRPHDLRRRTGPGRIRDRPPGGLQRRRNRGDHHDHGPGAEAAGGPDLRQLAPPAPGAAVLYPELHLRRDLLEQPPSPAARRPPDIRRGDVVQPAPAVLAVADPGADRVGRRAPHEDRPGRDVRDRGPGL